MQTRKARQVESQLNLALEELKLSRELCSQLTCEREDNEKILLEALGNNTKLKTELSTLHSQYENVLEEQNRSKMVLISALLNMSLL